MCFCGIISTRSNSIYFKHIGCRKDSYIIMNRKAIEARRAYQKAWREKNRDKVKAAQQRYWERKAAQQATQEPPKE